MALTDNCIIYYKLDETTGGTASEEVSSQDGTLTNMENEDWVSAQINNGLDFDGSNEYVSCGNIGDMDYPFSINVWFNSDSIATTQSIIAKGISATGYSRFDCRVSSSKLRFLVYHTAGDNDIVGDTTLTSDTWYMGTFVVTATHMYCYLNGSSDATAVANSNAKYGTVAEQSLSIGEFFFGTTHENPYNGTIDEVGIWDRELDADEISELWNSGDGLQYPFVSGTLTQINIGDTWKEVPAMKINIGDAWKEVSTMKINIGDTWKEVF